jgi:WD40 repeat protein
MRLLFFIFLTSLTTSIFSQRNPFTFHKKLSTWGTGYNTVATNKVTFSSDEKYLAAGTTDGTFLIWDIESGQILTPLFDRDDVISTYDTKFSPDGKYLVSVGSIRHHKGIKIWDAQNYEVVRIIKYDTTRRYHVYEDKSISPRTISSICFTPDSRYMITADLDGMIKIWETGTWKLIFTKETKDRIWDIDISNHGDRFVSADEHGTTSIWTFNKGKLKLENSFLPHDYATSLSICENGNYYSVNGDDSLKIIDILTGRIKEVLMVINPDSVHTHSIISVCFDPTGKYFASGHTFNDIKIWSTENIGQMWQLRGDINNPDQNEYGYLNTVEVYFSPSGKILALSNDAGFIYLYKRE